VAPLTAGTENVSPVDPAQGEVFAPVGVFGTAGMLLALTASGELAVPVPQALIAATVMLPATAPAPAVTVIVFVVAPPVIVQPVGSVHA
jgi:hypothetical protein